MNTARVSCMLVALTMVEMWGEWAMLRLTTDN